MIDPLELITEGCYLGLRFGMSVSAVPTGNLRLVEGTYGFARGQTYHPLEAALVSATATGDWLADAATFLGVSQEWVNGFLAGFAQEPEKSTDAEYVQGFLAAEELRVQKYRRELPDK